MREIKFRGVSADSWKLVYGSLVNNLWTVNKTGEAICEILTTENYYDCWEDMDDSGNVVKVIPGTVGQFTGLQDKNGKEIYEGDIVSMPIDKGGTVVWDSDWARWGSKKNGNSIYGFSTAYNVEVIGNIYENPELIK